jgi:hypothetical protein
MVDFGGLATEGQTRLGNFFTNTIGVPKKKSSPTWTINNIQPGMEDWRLKVKTNIPGMFNNQSDKQTNILSPLLVTGGVIFPITPTVQVSHTAKYSNETPTHSNYAMPFYQGSEVASITINGEFPIQNISEGQYLLAAIYFFRSVTKMFWGKDTDAGAPPPLVYLSGYGDLYFPNVPCVVTQFMHNLPDNTDYIEIPTLGQALNRVHVGEIGGSTRLPLQSQISITLQPVYSRDSLSRFRLDQFSTGGLLDNKDGFL